MQNGKNFRDNYYFKSISIEDLKENYINHDLTDEDLTELISYSKMLPVVSQLKNNCDTFIDCMTKDRNVAIVIAQCSPKNSVYEHSYIGRKIHRHKEPGVFKSYEKDCTVIEMKASIKNFETGTEVLVKQNITVLKNKNGKKIGVIISEKNLSGEEKNLMPYISYNYSIGNIISDCIIFFNRKGDVIFANESAKKYYNKKLGNCNIFSSSLDALSPKGYNEQDILAKELIIDEKIKDHESYYNIIHSIINVDNTNLGFAILIKDITEKVLKDKELILKSLAVQEIHHRVKNNLQTIISLIRLQLNRTQNKDIKNECDIIISRISSIAITHELLATSNIDKIDIKEILNSLTTNTLNFVSIKNINLNIFVEGESCYVSSDIGTTIGIIVNELLQNSITHGFNFKKNCKIRIKVLKSCNHFGIIVTDNGNGYKNIDVTSSSLGLKLVKSLVEDKLMGELKITSSNEGTKTYFSFTNTTLY
ncbi:MAG: histidine kinase N-terminal domain-containing protein [Lachnospirales bacterium]